MDIIKVILVYISVVIAIAIIPNVVSLILTPHLRIERKNKVFAPFNTFLTSLFSTFVAFMVVIWFSRLIEVQPTLLMFLIPFYLIVNKNYKRIYSAKNSRTAVEQVSKKFGTSFDSQLQVKMEYGYLSGDILAIVIFFLITHELPLY
jgi:hypothetical protein